MPWLRVGINVGLDFITPFKPSIFGMYCCHSFIVSLSYETDIGLKVGHDFGEDANDYMVLTSHYRDEAKKWQLQEEEQRWKDRVKESDRAAEQLWRDTHNGADPPRDWIGTKYP